MRIFLILLALAGLTSASLYADGSTPPPSTFFEKNLKKVGEHLDKTAAVVKEKVKAESKTLPSRLSAAFDEMGEGLQRAWKKLKGETP